MSPLPEVPDLAGCFGGEVEALRGVGFDLERGESLAVVGQEGSSQRVSSSPRTPTAQRLINASPAFALDGETDEVDQLTERPGR